MRDFNIRSPYSADEATEITKKLFRPHRIINDFFALFLFGCIAGILMFDINSYARLLLLCSTIAVFCAFHQYNKKTRQEQMQEIDLNLTLGDQIISTLIPFSSRVAVAAHVQQVKLQGRPLLTCEVKHLLRFIETDLEMVKIQGEAGGISVAYSVTQPMVDVALSEAKKIGLVISESEIKQILQAVVAAA